MSINLLIKKVDEVGAKDDSDKATCDVCGGLPTRRCFDCPYDHRSCDECSCDEWQRLCDKSEGDSDIDKGKGDEVSLLLGLLQYYVL